MDGTALSRADATFCRSRPVRPTRRGPGDRHPTGSRRRYPPAAAPCRPQPADDR